EAGRHSGRAADQIRSRHQSNRRPSAWPRSACDAARPRRRGDRMIGRREFITLFGGATAWPLGVIAQVSTKRPLVGLVNGQSSASAAPVVTAFVRRMQELGYVAGSDIDIAYRYANGDLARGPALADERASRKPD